MIFESWKHFAKVLGNRTRFDIITLLRKEGEFSVSEICQKLGYEQSRVSHNLKCLLNCGFVEVEQRGKKRVYRTSQIADRILDILETYMAEYHRQLVSCGVLKEEKNSERKVEIQRVI